MVWARKFFVHVPRALTSTVRDPRRGYLTWGAFVLGRATDRAELEQGLRRVEEANAAWGLGVPIRWRPEGAPWQQTAAAARRLAETYQVIYATEGGARSSNHHEGCAVDLVARVLPRELTSTAPHGAPPGASTSRRRSRRGISASAPS